VVEHEIKKKAKQVESPKRRVAANVRSDFNDFGLRHDPARLSVFLTVPAISRQQT
jgi:hypothetical protein